MIEIKVSFLANVDSEEDLLEVKRVFGSVGAEIITNEVPECKDVGCFEVCPTDRINTAS